MGLEMPLFNLQQKENSADAMPLAAKMRPQSFADFVGQEHLLGKGKVLRRCIETGTRQTRRTINCQIELLL